MDVKPIRNDADRDRALAEIEQYFDSPPHPARRRQTGSTS